MVEDVETYQEVLLASVQKDFLLIAWRRGVMVNRYLYLLMVVPQSIVVNNFLTWIRVDKLSIYAHILHLIFSL